MNKLRKWIWTIRPFI